MNSETIGLCDFESGPYGLVSARQTVNQATWVRSPRRAFYDCCSPIPFVVLLLVFNKNNRKKGRMFTYSSGQYGIQSTALGLPGPAEWRVLCSGHVLAAGVYQHIRTVVTRVYTRVTVNSHRRPTPRLSQHKLTVHLQHHSKVARAISQAAASEPFPHIRQRHAEVHPACALALGTSSASPHSSQSPCLGVPA